MFLGLLLPICLELAAFVLGAKLGTDRSKRLIFVSLWVCGVCLVTYLIIRQIDSTKAAATEILYAGSAALYCIAGFAAPALASKNIDRAAIGVVSILVGYVVGSGITLLGACFDQCW